MSSSLPPRLVATTKKQRAPPPLPSAVAAATLAGGVRAAGVKTKKPLAKKKKTRIIGDNAAILTDEFFDEVNATKNRSNTRNAFAKSIEELKTEEKKAASLEKMNKKAKQTDTVSASSSAAPAGPASSSNSQATASPAPLTSIATSSTPAVSKISSKEAKKLAKIAAAKAQKVNRQEFYSVLQANRVSEDTKKLLLPSASLSKKETKREKLKREFLKVKAGILKEEESDLLQGNEEIDETSAEENGVAGGEKKKRKIEKIEGKKEEKIKEKENVKVNMKAGVKVSESSDSSESSVRGNGMNSTVPLSSSMSSSMPRVQTVSSLLPSSHKRKVPVSSSSSSSTPSTFGFGLAPGRWKELARTMALFAPDEEAAAEEGIYSINYNVMQVNEKKKPKKRKVLILGGKNVEENEEENEAEEEEEDEVGKSDDEDEEEEGESEEENMEMNEDDDQGSEQMEAEENEDVEEDRGVDDSAGEVEANPEQSDDESGEMENADLAEKEHPDGFKEFFSAHSSTRSAHSLKSMLQAHKSLSASAGTSSPSSSSSLSNPLIDTDYQHYRLSNNALPFLASDAAREAATSKSVLKANPFVVRLLRDEKIQAARMKLPVCAQEQEIVEVIQQHNIVLLCGATGSGKTTQVPQFLYEAGFGSEKGPFPGLIGVTEPRRVAAISMCRRVAVELNAAASPATSSLVAYQIRYDSQNLTPNTRIKFMTDGILLREIQSDFLLLKYSVIILDEAHERNINTDILIGLLSRIVPLRERLAQKWLRRQKYKANSTGQRTNEEEDDEDEEEDEQILEVKAPLKLIIMSATMRVDDFVANDRLFPAVRPPLLNIQSRQYPVTVHFNRFTPLNDWVDRTLHKVCKMHVKLPPGGILVFLTGRQEIQIMCKKLKKIFNEKKIKKRKDEEETLFARIFKKRAEKKKLELEKLKEKQRLKEKKEKKREREKKAKEEEEDMNVEEKKKSKEEETEEEKYYIDEEDDAKEEAGLPDPEDELEDDEEESARMEDERAAVNDRDADDEVEDESVRIASSSATSSSSKSDVEISSSFKANLPTLLSDLSGLTSTTVRVLPLYSMLSTKEQMEIFAPVKENERLIVLATNIAETSLTIPGVSYVLDTGREKVRRYNQFTGASSYVIQWISKSSAEQRAGRAARTGPGHVYRLFSSAVFENIFEQFTPPEILRMPIESAILQMKNMKITQLRQFPFPTQPDERQMNDALKTLKLLGAIEDAEGKKGRPGEEEEEEKITPLGSLLAHFPLLPRYSKMIVLALKIIQKNEKYENVIDFIITIVAAMAVPELFIAPNEIKLKDKPGQDKKEMPTGQKELTEKETEKKDDKDDNDEEDEDEMRMDEEETAASAESKKAEQVEKERRSLMQKAYNAVQMKWRSSSSDLLTLLNVISGFEFFSHSLHQKFLRSSTLPLDAQQQKAITEQLSRAKRKFCAENFLRLKSLNEILKLKKQLKKIVLGLIAKTKKTKTAENGRNGESGDQKGEKGEWINDEVENDAEKEEREMDERNDEEDDEDDSADTAIAAGGTDSDSSAAPSLTSETTPLFRLVSHAFARSSMVPPSDLEETLLCQLISSGFVDHVARRLRMNEALLRNLTEKRREVLGNQFKEKATEKEFAFAYEPFRSLHDEDEQHTADLDSDDDNALQSPFREPVVYVHPSSLFFSNDAALLPDYFVYIELLQNRKSRYSVKFCTRIQFDWLLQFSDYLCSFSAPIQSIPPKYDSDRDSLVVQVNAYFGDKKWEMPRQKRAIKEPLLVSASNTKGQLQLQQLEEEYYRHWTRCLLEGQIFEDLLPFRPYLQIKPSALLPTHVLHWPEKVKAIFNELRKNRVFEKKRMVDRWTKDKRWLLGEFKALVQPIQQDKVVRSWPPKA